MAERPNLDEDKGGKLIDPTRFRGMVGSLMYLSASRPDIVFAVCMCARYQDVMTHGEDTSGSAQFLEDIGLLAGQQKSRKSMSISTTEAEYIALSGCCAQILWMRSQLRDYGFAFNKIPMYCDNQSAIALCCIRVTHSRSKLHCYPSPLHKERSNGHTVADSIGERSKQPTAYKFKTDCMILWNAEERDVVPPGYSYDCYAWFRTAPTSEVDFLTSAHILPQYSEVINKRRSKVFKEVMLKTSQRSDQVITSSSEDHDQAPAADGSTDNLIRLWFEEEDPEIKEEEEDPEEDQEMEEEEEEMEMNADEEWDGPKWNLPY
ncbi:hypothetical protein Tco_0970013 [Tanacetum coccineum]